MNLKEFPVSSLIPKEETECLKFLERHGLNDGRGVVVAILDSGIDPGALNLQVTTDGKPKIIDIIDASGAGDIDTKTIRRVDNGLLELYSGRSVKVPETWNNPSGAYHVGMKRVYDLFPSVLSRRVKEDAKKEWEKGHRRHTSAVAKDLALFDAVNPDKANLSVSLKKERQDLEDRLAQLNAFNKSYEEPGPFLDAIMFHDGDQWKACLVGTDQSLTDVKLMSAYKVKQEYGTFTDDDMMNYSFNMYDEGNVLSVCVCCSSHGTHVAGILAAHNPKNTEMNGVAPGAQIVSINIGDYRLGSMETGTSLVRALGAVIECKADLINMSYGEDVHVSEVGQFIELAQEVVNKHDVIFVSSAGNDGPALSTTTAPAGACTDIVSVAACVTEPMMDVQYSLREQLPTCAYTWSSRGPSYAGGYGVTICAPGGAIAPVPNFSLKAAQLMNGTSMASPNACGGFALILSGLKQAGIKYTTHRVRKGVENTALNINEMGPYTQGHGMIQVNAAFEHICTFEDYFPLDANYKISVPTFGSNIKGIYLREKEQTSRTIEATVSVQPVFSDKIAAMAKINFQVNVRLTCDAEWVEVPQNFVMLNEERSFNVKVNCNHKSLTPGPYITEVKGYDINMLEAGPLFTVPITVLKTEPNTEITNPDAVIGPRLSYSFDLFFKSPSIRRKILDVPIGAEWADVKLTGMNIESGDRKFIIHAQQLLPQIGHQQTEFKAYVSLTNQKCIVKSFAVTGGVVMEMCLAQFWSSLGSSDVKLEVYFHGITPDQREVYVTDNVGITRVNITSPLQQEVLLPSISVKTSRQCLRPVTHTITPEVVNPYDVLIDNRQVYGQVLDYPFTQTEACDVIARCPLLNTWLYDGEYQSQMYQLYDKNNRVFMWGESAPKDMVKLEKGEYILRVKVCSDKTESLDRLKDMVMVIDRTLTKEIKMDTYSTYTNALMERKKFEQRELKRGERCTVFIAPPTNDKIPSYLKAGDALIGKITYGKCITNQSGAGKKPNGFPITYVIPSCPTPTPKCVEANPEDEPKKTQWENLQEAVRDQQIGYLAKLLNEEEGKSSAHTLFKELSSSFPDYIPLFSAWVKGLDDNSNNKDVPLDSKSCRDVAVLNDIIEASQKVISMVDSPAVAEFFGLNADNDDPQYIKNKVLMTDKKEALIDALRRKSRALVELALTKNPEESSDYWTAAQSSLSQLSQWVDANDTGLLMIRLVVERGLGHSGTAMKAATTLLDDTTVSTDIKRKLCLWRIDVAKALGWDHVIQYENRSVFLRYPKALAPL